MNVQLIQGEFAVARLRRMPQPANDVDWWFVSMTPEEISLVCRPDAVPADAEKVEPGWRMFKVAGPLQFSMVGILSRITGALAAKRIPLFAISTYDTDYIIVKEPMVESAKQALTEDGWTVID
ncbi:MAG: ACT domain-containing protein [Planctomycetes bacterium]|nr:ACT domain-containing protein [Planctomycetota bacterium]